MQGELFSDTDTIHGPLEFRKAVDKMLRGDRARTVIPAAKYFRPGTELPVVRINYVLQGAGIGDYICMLPALLWTAQNNPWIEGRVFVGEMLVELFSNFFVHHKEWKVQPLERINELVEAPSTMRGPGITMNGVKYQQLVNGCGGNLVQLGFCYYVNMMNPPPDSIYHPQIDFFRAPAMTLNLPGQAFTYAVLTPGGVSENRTIPGEAWNPIIKHLLARGITPVVLGKSKVVAHVPVHFPPGMDYSNVINLIDKTTHLEAAWIMKHAAVTVGLDNGLIHLAACTDAPLVAGYNMVHPRDRAPIRKIGKFRSVYLRDHTDREPELACSGCQTYMKNMFPHTFNQCLYKIQDSARGGTTDRIAKCVRMLFDNQASKWIAAIDSILDEG